VTARRPLVGAVLDRLVEVVLGERRHRLQVAQPRRGARPGAAGDKLAEGAFTAAVLTDMALAKGVDMPVAAAVAAVLEERINVDGAIEALLTRPLKGE